jgi:phytoene dehydrogenase-like protein
VRERADAIGGGLRTSELTLPGFRHDVCSAIHPLAVSSPFFRQLPLADHGLQWIEPPLPLAHPLDDGTAVVLDRSVDQTAAQLGEDGAAYRRLFKPLVEDWGVLEPALLGPLVRPPRHPVALARFGLTAIRPARGLARARFSG